MKIKLFLPLVFVFFCSSLAAQDDLSVTGIMNKNRSADEKQMLVIRQDSRIDTLVSRHILYNARHGVRGWRIQIYRGGHRAAQEEAQKIRASFINDFPDCPTHLSFEKPNWFKVRVGDFRTREEAAVIFYKILEKYPGAYLIKDNIEFKNTGR